MSTVASTLTTRQLEVLNLIAQGQSSTEVADALYIAKRTVDFHLDTIYKRFNCHNRIQAIKHARHEGIIS